MKKWVNAVEIANFLVQNLMPSSWVPGSQVKKTCKVQNNFGSFPQHNKPSHDFFPVSCLSSSLSTRAPNSSILTWFIKSWSMLCIQTPLSVAKSLPPPWQQQLSMDSTSFSFSNQSTKNWSLSHVHLDRSRLAGSLTAQLSCVPMSLFGHRQHILGGAERWTRAANLPFWKSCGFMKSCQASGAALSDAALWLSNRFTLLMCGWQAEM